MRDRPNREKMPIATIKAIRRLMSIKVADRSYSSRLRFCGVEARADGGAIRGEGEWAGSLSPSPRRCSRYVTTPPGKLCFLRTCMTREGRWQRIRFPFVLQCQLPYPRGPIIFLPIHPRQPFRFLFVLQRRLR